jgi:hypothetical protein
VIKKRYIKKQYLKNGIRKTIFPKNGTKTEFLKNGDLKNGIKKQMPIQYTGFFLGFIRLNGFYTFSF